MNTNPYLSVEPRAVDSDGSTNRVYGKQISIGKFWFLAPNFIPDFSIISLWVVQICGSDCNHYKVCKGKTGESQGKARGKTGERQGKAERMDLQKHEALQL